MIQQKETKGMKILAEIYSSTLTENKPLVVWDDDCDGAEVLP